MTWHMTAVNDSFGWYEFCLSFMSEEMTVRWQRMFDGSTVAVVSITIDPHKPIDSTGSMPSLIDQAKAKGFDVKVWAEEDKEPPLLQCADCRNTESCAGAMARYFNHGRCLHCGGYFKVVRA